MACGGAWPRRRIWLLLWQRRIAVAVSLVLVIGLCMATQAVMPAAAAASTHATTISAGSAHSCRIQSGRAYCWGSSSSGQLGNGSVIGSAGPVAVSVSGVLAGKTLIQVTSGTNFSCALDSAGAAYCWGLGTGGQLGNGGTASSTVPVAVSTSGVLAGKTLTQITAGASTVCALDSAGAAYCWGTGGSGQLGNGTTTAAQATPVAVTASGVLAGKTLTQIAAGATHACALSSAGAAYCWGSDSNGQLGNNSTTQSPVPVAVTASGVLAGKTLTQIAGGQVHTCAIDSAGAAYCWGSGTNGRLGNGGTAQSLVPVMVTAAGVLAGKTLTEITAGTATTCAVDSAGAAYCWGAGASGQLGNNTTTTSQTTAVTVTATGVLAGKTLTQISAGSSGSQECAQDSAGGAYCWGLNSSGQLGNPATSKNFSVPAAVTSQATSIDGATHSCTISGGNAYCWGAGGSGQLGNGTTTTAQTTAVTVTTSGVLSGKTLFRIAAGGSNTCAVDSAGAAYCWGAGGSGQLGNGTTTTAQTTAVTVTTSGVLSGKTLTQITGGGNHVCALDTTGAAYCWGADSSGQLGNGTTTTPQTTAVAVTTAGALSGKTLVQIAGGGAYTCALDGAGVAYCWGLNSSGQLGNNSTAQSNVAVTVAPQGPTGVSAVAGDTTAAVSWAAPVFLNGGVITGYTATAAPGGALCSTTSATSCTITGLTDGTTYTITVTVTATTGTASGAPVTVTPVGFLSISVPSAVSLPATAPGGTISARLGTVTVTDNRALGSASWTATVTGTAFTTGGGSGPETIPATQVTYWSGPATATSGSGTFTPGQPNAASAVDLSTARTAFSLTGGSGVNSASWNPTLSVLVPAGAVGGTYTATITHSVS